LHAKMLCAVPFNGTGRGSSEPPMAVAGAHAMFHVSR
jgi:hypothetical protein